MYLDLKDNIVYSIINDKKYIEKKIGGTCRVPRVGQSPAPIKNKNKINDSVGEDFVPNPHQLVCTSKLESSNKNIIILDNLIILDKNNLIKKELYNLYNYSLINYIYLSKFNQKLYDNDYGALYLFFNLDKRYKILCKEISKNYFLNKMNINIKFIKFINNNNKGIIKIYLDVNLIKLKEICYNIIKYIKYKTISNKVPFIPCNKLKWKLNDKKKSLFTIKSY